MCECVSVRVCESDVGQQNDGEDSTNARARRWGRGKARGMLFSIDTYPMPTKHFNA